MTKTSKRNTAAHTTRPNAARLEAPKDKSAPRQKSNESDRPDAPLNLTGKQMTNSETPLNAFLNRFLPMIDEGFAMSVNGLNAEELREAMESAARRVFADDTQSLEAPDVDAEGFDLLQAADQASRELAMAFATIEKWRDYIPTGVYNRISDSINDFCNIPPWQTDPRLMVKTLPSILRAATLRDWEDTPV